jgi:hypothetical protein
MFAKMDTSHDGTLQPNEFKRGLRQLDIGANIDTTDIARYLDTHTQGMHSLTHVLTDDAIAFAVLLVLCLLQSCALRGSSAVLA